MSLTKIQIPAQPAETIDARGQILGRLATQVATKLLGKDLPAFDPTVQITRPITVINAKDIQVTGRKADQKIYYRHTGYPGGLRQRTYREMMIKDPTEIIRHAVAGMLPKNRLHAPRMNQLTVVAEDQNNE